MGNFKDKHGQSRVGKWIKDNAPHLVDVVGEVLPEKGALGLVKNIIQKDDKISAEKRLEAMQLIDKELEFILAEQENITERWRLDMTSDSWLSKNIRPMVLIFLLVLMTVLVIWDSATHGVIDKGVVMVADSFKVDQKYVKLLADLLWIVFLAYFGGRTIEKFKRK